MERRGSITLTVLLLVLYVGAYAQQYTVPFHTNTSSGGGGTVSTPTYVQAADCSELDGDPITAASTYFQCRFPQPTLGGSGDIIVAGFVQGNNTTRRWAICDGSCTVYAGTGTTNTYTYVTKTDSTNTELSVMAYTVNDTSVQIVTFAATTTAEAMRAPYVLEFTGVGGGFDKAAAGNNASSTTVTAGSTTPTGSGELIIQQAVNEYIGGYSAGASTFTAGSQANITWSLIVHDSFVPMAVQAGTYNATAAINPTMSETTAGFVSEALFFKAGTGPALPSGLWVNSLKHIWLTGPTSPFTISFPCPSTDNVAFYQFEGNPNGPDDTTAITLNGHSMTQTHAKTTVGTAAMLHNYYLENQTLSPSQNFVITGTFSGANAMAYCFTSPNASSSFQSGNVPTPTTGNQSATGAYLQTSGGSPLAVISITPNNSGDLLFVTTGIANNTLVGLTGTGQYFMDEFWSSSVGNSGQMDQGNGFGFMLAPNTSSQGFAYNLYFTSLDALGDWVSEADEFH